MKEDEESKGDGAAQEESGSTAPEVEAAGIQTVEAEPAAEQDDLAALRKEARDNYDRYLRALADLENFKKRALKERSDLLRYAGEALAYDLLEVMDNFERALSHLDTASSEDLLAGVRLIADNFSAVLQKHSIRGESAVGKPFDPSRQEALSTVETEEYQPGMVMNELRKAYFFKDKLLRPAQVVVSAAPKQGGG